MASAKSLAWWLTPSRSLNRRAPSAYRRPTSSRWSVVSRRSMESTVAPSYVWSTCQSRPTAKALLPRSGDELFVQVRAQGRHHERLDFSFEAIAFAVVLEDEANAHAHLLNVGTLHLTRLVGPDDLAAKLER